MSSRFGWLDHDDAERDRMMELVKLFQDKGSVDELGIGSIRDAFSNSFFPGTSFQHTRVRYLLFIPWLLADVARRGRSVSESRSALRDAEVRLIRALIAGGEKRNVIGSQAQDRLKTMPSQAYWPALGTLGLLRWDVTVDNYFRVASQRVRRSVEVGAGDFESGRVDLGLDSALPEPPEDLLRATTFALTHDEADALKAVFARLPSSSLLSWMAANATSATGESVWEHPQVGDMPDEHRVKIDHARRLHHVWQGAPLLYNLMLARLTDKEELIELYTESTDEWLRDLEAHRALEGWSRPDFWLLVRQLNPQIGAPTITFVNHWIDLVEAGDHASVDAERLVRDRELRLKGRRSRIAYPDAREAWSGGAGLVPLDYRWSVAQRFLGDVLTGLNEGAA